MDARRQLVVGDRGSRHERILGAAPNYRPEESAMATPAEELITAVNTDDAARVAELVADGPVIGVVARPGRRVRDHALALSIQPRDDRRPAGCRPGARRLRGDRPRLHRSAARPADVGSRIGVGVLARRVHRAPLRGVLRQGRSRARAHRRRSLGRRLHHERLRQPAAACGRRRTAPRGLPACCSGQART